MEKHLQPGPQFRSQTSKCKKAVIEIKGGSSGLYLSCKVVVIGQ